MASTAHAQHRAVKMAQLSIPDNVCNWIVEFLPLQHSHHVRYSGELSAVQSITASTVQGLAYWTSSVRSE